MFNQYFPYSNSMQTTTQVGFRVFPVANIEEANACQVDYLGNPLFFYNKAHQEMYLKKFDPESGLVDFKRFKIVDMPQKNIETTIDVAELKEEINGIKEELRRFAAYFETKTKKGVKDDE